VESSTLFLLVLLVTVAAFFDIRYHLLPNWLNAAAAAAGFINAYAHRGGSGLLFSLGGLAASFIAVLALHLFKAVEAGDVKLFGALGAITGIEFSLYSVMHSIVFAAIYGILILAVRRLLWTKLLETARGFLLTSVMHDIGFVKSLIHSGKIQMPFMYAVVPGVIVTIFYY
jgi:prepilin peptidase CpaA